MSDIIGHVDARDRAIVPLSVPGQDDRLLITVDTGFNRELLVHQAEAARLRCDYTNLETEVEFAGGERRRRKIARTRILWFGRPQAVHVLIAPGGMQRAALPDEPVGLLGTALISPHTLTVDFAARRVVISEHANGAS